MFKKLLSNLLLLFSLLIVLISFNLNAQQTVFTETFNGPGTPQNITFTTSGQIGTSRWAVTRSGNDFGAKIDGGMLTLNNDITAAANATGWVMASTSTSNYTSLYKPILNENAGVVSWTFNMRQIRANPSGFNVGNFGVAFILAGTPGTTNTAGKGYAIVLGQPANQKIDAIKLATYSNGIASLSPKITSNTIGLKDFGAEYTSIRVEYNPAGNKWSLYLRKDNSTSFQDPNSGTLVFQDEVVISDYVGEELKMMGAFWNANKGKLQTSFFDNVSVKVKTPELISLDPDSKIANSGAFNLTLNGEGFLPTSKVYWNGALRTTTYVSETQLTAAILATDLSLPGTVPVTVANGTYISNSLLFTIESSGVPVLTLSATSLPAVSTVTGTFSNPTNTYTINGNNLIAGATVTAPANFEISKDGSTYANVLTLPYGAGTLTGQPITLRTRLTAAAPAGNYTGNISHTSQGALTKQVAVSGRVYATEPTSNASGLAFSNITSTGFKLDWAIGNGAQRLVLIREAAAVTTLPSGGITYIANTAFGTGSQIGTGNFVVYKGAGTSVQITGLIPNTAYYISIVEFNGGPATENYRTVGATGNTTTLNSPVGLQVKALNTSYKINFDDTVDGVNLDTFQGIGISKIAESGQLDSDSWAFSGFASPNIAFGGESPEDSSYENGPSDGEEDDTGIYAFNVGTPENQNYTLGIQPGGTDFNPGTITLRVQNQTGAALSSLNIGYKVYVYNDQPTSSRIRFSYASSATGTYTDQNIVDIISPAAADLAPGWKVYYRSVTITTTIAKDAYYYIRWTGSLDLGSGAQDEFAIDDIEVIANPVSPNTVSFDGIAEDFVLQGNASLSNDLSVQNRIVFNGGKLAVKDKTLTITGSVINTTTNGLTGGATSKLVMRGNLNPTLSFDQTTPGTTNLFDSFSLIGSTANTVQVANAFSVNQLLKVDALQTLDLVTSPLGGSLTSIQNNGTILTQNTSTTPFTSGKTWAGTGVLNLNAATAAQNIVAGNYTNLKLSSAGAIGGTVATGNIGVNGKLDLPNANPTAQNGSLSMGTFTLTMGDNGTNTGVGEVTGIIKRDVFQPNKLYTFGHPNSSITFPPVGTLPTSMSAKLTIGTAPTWKVGTILRQFDIIQTGAVDTKAIIRQHYLDSELNSNVESKLVFWAHTISPLNTFDQGRSNNNMTDNWVEISNADVGLYFKSTFDQVFISLDETSGSDLVWNGSTSTNWITNTNWTPNGVPSASTKVFIPNVSTTSNRSPIINANSSVKTITIDAGGIVNTPDNSVLTVYEGAGAWQNNGTFNPGNGNVIFNSIDATISGSTTFNNLTIATAAGLRALDGNYMSIAGTFTNGGTMFTTLIANTIEFKGTNQIIPAPGGEAFGGYHNLIVTGTGATIAAAISTLNVRGNLTLNQVVPFTGKTVNLAGISNQTIGGTAAINFNNLIVNKETGAVILAQDISVDGTLTLTKGNVVLGTKNLTLGSNAVAGTFGTNTMIVADGTGVVRRPFAGIGSYLFPIGELDGAPSYAPITVNVTAGTFSNAFVGVNVTHAKHPNNNSSQNYLKKYWNVTQTGITAAQATITATYDALDIIGSESEIAAAQLSGTFNATTNPWIKFGALSSNTLVATNATLTSGQTSSFTGLKAGTVGLEVYGYGDFCEGSTHTMNAVISGGDAPFNYVWSNGLENAGVVTIPTANEGEIYYTLTVYDANGFSATDTNIPVEIFPASFGGTVSNASQQICAGTIPSDLKLNGSVGKILYWQKSTVTNFATFENLSVFTPTISGAQIGPVSTTTYIRAVLQNGDCPEVFSNVAIITFASTTWTGTWSSGEPNSSTSAIFEANYTAIASIEACSIVVNNNAIVTIPTGFDVTVNGAVTIESGNFTLESNTNLIQLTDAVNSGAISVKRNSSPLYRLDYTMWGSPLSGAQNLKSFSPQTLSTRFYKYDSSLNLFDPINPQGTVFTPAQGYLIRMPDNHISFGGSNLAQTWTGTFTGVPNNGPINVALDAPDQGFNMLANPYPSMIDADKFLFANSAEIDGTLYFWRRRNAVPDASAYYATYTKAGGTGTAGSASAPTQIPNGFIQVGQGFLVRKIAGGLGNATFTNEMRTKVNTGNQFFRTTNKDKRSRIWLNVTNANGEFGQTLIAYMPSADNGVDSSDGKYINDGAIALTSWLDNSDYIIQGRAPFTDSDVVPLNFKTATAGSYTIAIDHVDGLFIGNQDVFLKDNFTGVLHNLKTSAYTFATQAGSFNSRFDIMYANTTLSTENPLFDSNSIVLYKQDNRLIINSGKVVIDHVEVFDISGKLLIASKKINSNKVSINVGQTNQILIVKITSTDGVTVNMKTIN